MLLSTTTQHTLSTHKYNINNFIVEISSFKIFSKIIIIATINEPFFSFPFIVNPSNKCQNEKLAVFNCEKFVSECDE